MHPFLASHKDRFQTAADHLQRELSVLRTGRANPALFEEIRVAAYDSTMELKGLASINVQDAKTILIEPWDASLVQAIEKAIRDADLGISPAVDGKVIRIVLPPMTEESRKKLAKTVKEKLEEARVAMRQVREKLREDLGKQEKEKKISEDEKFKALEELDEMTKQFTAQAEAYGKKKEEEIMTV